MMIGVLAAMFGKVSPSGPSEPETGSGADRAAQRLYEHRAQWDGVQFDAKDTRQQRRARARAAEKARRSDIKARARTMSWQDRKAFLAAIETGNGNG